MSYLTDADYDDLPEDNGAAFSKLEGLSRKRLHESSRDSNGDIRFEDMLRYMNEISAIAEEFGFDDIGYNEEPNHYSHEFARFTRLVDARVTQIRLQTSRRNGKHSVRLSSGSRTKIQHHLEKLKSEVDSSSLDPKRKRALLDKIVEFEAELAKPRLNMATAMALVASVASLIADTGDIAAMLPSYDTFSSGIIRMIGQDKQAEVDAAALLPRYVAPKALEDHSAKVEVKPASTRPTDDFGEPYFGAGGLGGKGGFGGGRFR